MTSDAVLGIDIGGTKISLCAATSSGEVLVSERLPTRSGEGADAVLRRLLAAAAALVFRVRAEHAVGVRGVGVVTPGVVREDSVQLAPNNAGWDQVALVDTVRDGLGVGPVLADNDAKAATAAEARWGALAGVTDGVLLNLGTGISAGAVVGGTLLRGAHGAALEIAYQVPTTRPGAGFAHGRAPLEETFSGAGLAASASALLGRPAGTGEVFAAMAEASRGAPDDERARLAELGREALRMAARTVANLAVTLDPEVIAVSGGMLRSADQILPSIEAALAELVPFPPRLVLAQFGDHAPLAGACLLAYQAADMTAPQCLDLGTVGALLDQGPARTEDG